MTTATTVLDRPILMSAPMVRALLDGTKTQTRRIVKPQPAGEWAAPGRTMCPYGRIGDTLWCRETHQIIEPSEGHTICVYRATCDDDRFLYAWPDGTIESLRILKWRPAIHMKREHSRITLEITDVRCERLQEASEADARAEGVSIEDTDDLVAFMALWNKLNGKRAPWGANPWVWAVSFRRIKSEATS